MGGMVSQLLAPWMTSGAFNPADYGGTQNLGANLLAQSGPSQMPMTTAQRLGLALQGAQKSGLQNAAARQQVATGGFQLQRMMESWPTMLAAMKQLAGNPSQGAPQGMQPQGQPQGQGLPFSRAPTPANTQTPINAPPSYLAANQGVAQGAPQGSPQQSPQMGATGTDPTSQYLNYARLNAVLGMGGMSSPGLTDYAKMGLANDPTAITQRGAAGSSIAKDQMLYSQALQSGNSTLADFIKNVKMPQDLGALTIARNSGTVVRADQNGGISTVSPSTGLATNNGFASLMPGMAQAIQQKATAQSAGALRGQIEPVGGGSGAAPTGSGSPPLAHPQRQGAAALNDPTYIPPILSAPALIKQQTGNTGLTAVKASQQQQGELVKESIDEFTKQAASAQDLLTTTKQIQQTAQDFTPGKFSTWRGEALNTLNSLNLLPKGWQNSLGSYQEGSKLTIQSQAMVTKALGSREAAQVFDKLGKSIPGLTLSADGLGKISAYQEGMARYKLAMSGFAHKLYDAGNLPGVLGVSTTFQAHTDPTYYILASATPAVRKELMGAMSQGTRAQVLSGWKKAVQLGLAPAPSDYAQ